MDISQQIRAFDELIKYVQNELPKRIQAIAAHDLVAMIINRVVQRGKDYRGANFSAYSDIKIAASEFIGKSRVASVDAKIRKMAAQHKQLSYKEFRAMNNLNTSKKNFEFTGEMWRKFGVIKFTSNGSTFKISIGGTTPAAQQKIDENSHSENESIIEANEQEADFFKAQINKLLNAESERIINGH